MIRIILIRRAIPEIPVKAVNFWISVPSPVLTPVVGIGVS